MLNIKKVSAISATTAAIFLSSNAMAVSSQLYANFKVITALSIASPTQALDFGAVSSASSGTLTVSTTGALTKASTVEVIGSSAKAASMQISGAQSQPFVVTVAKGLSNMAGVTFSAISAKVGTTDCTLDTNQSTATCSSVSLDSTGKINLAVGGTLTLGSGLAAAVSQASGSTNVIPYTVTAVYN